MRRFHLWIAIVIIGEVPMDAPFIGGAIMLAGIGVGLWATTVIRHVSHPPRWHAGRVGKLRATCRASACQ